MKEGLVEVFMLAATVAVGLLAFAKFAKFSPDALRQAEARLVRIEVGLEAAVTANQRTAELLTEHLEQTRHGYERVAALEQFAREAVRRIERLEKD